MKHTISKMICLLAMFCFIGLSGCNDPSTTTTEQHDDDGHDHDGDDHDGDDHDHGEHDGHDHDGDHDHGAHDSDDGHAGHDHGDGGHSHDFKTLAEAAKELGSLRDTIRDALADGKKDDAHGPLHHVVDVLEATEELVENLELDDDEKKAAHEAIESLFDSFGAVDEIFHNKEGKSYDDVSEAIDAAIKVLGTEKE